MSAVPLDPRTDEPTLEEAETVLALFLLGLGLRLTWWRGSTEWKRAADILHGLMWQMHARGALAALTGRLQENDPDQPQSVIREAA